MGNFDAPDAALDTSRTLWSYDNVLELRFREHLHPVTVFFFERTQDTFPLDFSSPVGDVLATILARFRVQPPPPHLEPSPISLRKLGGGELDRSRSLRQQNIKVGDSLLLKVAFGYETDPDARNEPAPQQRPPPPARAGTPKPGIKTPSRPPKSKDKDQHSPQQQQQLHVPPVPEDPNIWEETGHSDHVMYLISFYLDFYFYLVVVFDGGRFDGDKLQAGTLNKLVERLTSETTPDLNFMKAFLMTYL